MYALFENATSANPDVSGWDTAQVTDMSYMFADASNAQPDMSTWSVQNVGAMQGMFSNITLDTARFSNLLIKLAEQNQSQGVQFDGGGSQYNAAGSVARQNLIDQLGWQITDGGAAP